MGPSALARAQTTRYSSLQEAIYDNSLPEFDPRAYAGVEPKTPTTASALLGSYPSTPGYDDYFKHSPPAVYPGGLPKAHKKHPFSSKFESPEWMTIICHIIICLFCYPAIIATAYVTNGIPLFWTRFIVGLTCGITGFFIGWSILKLAQLHFEAATWATVIHRSRAQNAPGIKLKDLAAFSEDPTSAWSAILLLWDRVRYSRTSQASKQQKESRLWTMVIIFFLVLVAVAAGTPFILGRLVIIDTIITHQSKEYEEVAIVGRSSDADIKRATELKPMFNNYALTWTMAPFSVHGGLPPVVSFKQNDDTVYFSETTLSQLLPNGSGFGTFDSESQNSSRKIDQRNASTESVDYGSVLRFPRWGTRLHCAKLPNPELNIVARSPATFTYVYTPRAVVETLFSSFNMDYPTLKPFNASRVLQANDTLPTGLKPDEIAFGAAYYDNGVGHSFFSRPVSMGENGKGWVTIEQVLVRLNSTYTPVGKFPLRSEQSVLDAKGNPTWVGYDAAVCVQLFEPWIVEISNSTSGLPSSIRIVEAGNEVRSMDIHPEKMIGFPVTDTDVSRQLNSTGLVDVYECGHTNSVNQVLKDNGRDAYYVPSPTVVSFTDGKGPLGYTELSEALFAQARGLADASNLLPYFVGSGKTVARRYYDRVLSSASVNPIYLGAYLAFILVIGLLAGLFVPKLPLDIPHRGFQVYSWMAAFHADELIGIGSNTGIVRNMELDEIAERVGDLRFRFVNPHTINQ